MRVEEVKVALENIRSVLALGGAGAAERDLLALIRLLDAHGDREFDEYIEELRAEIEVAVSPPKPRLEGHVDRLKSAGLGEAEFKAALADLRADTSMQKPQVLKIANDLGVIRINSRSKSTIVESIEKHFYWLLYQRDAGEMAKRATPW